MAGAHKPIGFWVSDDSDYGWAEWCKDSGYGEYSYRYEVPLISPERLLWIRSKAELVDFANEFCELPRWARDISSMAAQPFHYREPFWGRVATKYAGVIITPYRYDLRMADGFTWYYSWDCASGVIWDGSVAGVLQQAPMIEPWRERTVCTGDAE